MKHVSWRDRARPIIAAALAETKGQSEEDIRATLFERYPFGVRKHYPHQVWLDEIRKQRGLLPAKPKRNSKAEPGEAESGDLFMELEETEDD